VYARIVEGTVGEDPADGIKPKGVIHWVAAASAQVATVRLYDRLFIEANPGKSEDVLAVINPASLRVIDDALVEPFLASVPPESTFQFEREGYFVADRYNHTADQPVFNMTIGLRDTWGGDA
jgi:glutaminyl-tRNA synthetase